MIKVKICGITTLEDADAAAEAGADALGFVFFQGSPRAVDVDTVAGITSALGPFTVAVGIFVNESAAVVNETVRRAGLDRVQLHGDEDTEYCRDIIVPVIKAFRVRGRNVLDTVPRYPVSAFLLDAYHEAEFGGTGERFDWEIAREAAGLGRLILSGGLTPENVEEAVARVRPYGVDVSSGVSPAGNKRRKDPVKVRAFVEAARRGWREVS